MAYAFVGELGPLAVAMALAIASAKPLAKVACGLAEAGQVEFLVALACQAEGGTLAASGRERGQEAGRRREAGHSFRASPCPQD